MNKNLLLTVLPCKFRTGFISSGFFRVCLLAAVLISSFEVPLAAEELDPEQQAQEERRRRNVAVALNYCRASFHRIRKYPTHEVMEEEQQKILNNLNLNGIHDEQIIKLYTDVLDEIGQMQLTDKETDLFQTKYRKAVRQEIAVDTLSIGLDLVTGQYVGAVRTGANGWWDYRNHQWNRDNELLKLEKTRVNSVVKKSASFLDTFWKMTRANNIPDRWLVRSTDLDDLEQAMNEADPQVRLRVLKRMQPYMECYPPYWYYLARTQQATGDLEGSLQIYRKLSEIADGHFRRDDMMTSALTNQAVIQAHLGDPKAAETARLALSYSTTVWEANLACARILQRSGQLADAEDAILRNLDVSLEGEHSITALLGFYHDTNNTTKLAQYLSDEKVLAKVPPPVLIRYASRLQQEQTPGVVWTALASSLRVEPQVGFGPDSILLACHPVWKINRSKIGLHAEGGRVIPGELVRQGEYDVIRFANVGEFGSLISGPLKLPQLKLEIQYGDKDPIMLAFNDPVGNQAPVVTKSTTTARAPLEAPVYQLVSAQWGERFVAQTSPVPKTAESDLPPPVPLSQRTSSLGQFATGVGEVRTAKEQSKEEQAEDETSLR